MKTLVAGAIAVLLGSAALVASAAAPASAAATVDAACKYLEVRIAGQPGTGNQLYYYAGRASMGEPTVLFPYGATFADHDYALIGLDPADSFIWRFEVHAPDGTVTWSSSGTTTPCWPVNLGRTLPVLPPEPPCGSTMDDVVWPSTPGIVYSHDQWFGFARLLPGWQWDDKNYKLGIGWALMDSVKSDLAVVDSAVVLDITGHCGIPRTAPPESALPGGKCWYQLPDPAPCSTPEYYTPSKPHVVAPGSVSATKLASPPTSSPLPPIPVTTAAPPPSATPTPDVAATTTPAASPAPSPSATPPVQATPRVGTSTGLGVAGGVAGACVMAAVGAFVVRRRLRPPPNAVAMDESE